jgi:hypothetical protein
MRVDRRGAKEGSQSDGSEGADLSNRTRGGGDSMAA